MVVALTMALVATVLSPLIIAISINSTSSSSESLFSDAGNVPVSESSFPADINSTGLDPPRFRYGEMPSKLKSRNTIEGQWSVFGYCDDEDCAPGVDPINVLRDEWSSATSHDDNPLECNCVSSTICYNGHAQSMLFYFDATSEFFGRQVSWWLHVWPDGENCDTSILPIVLNPHIRYCNQGLDFTCWKLVGTITHPIPHRPLPSNVTGAASPNVPGKVPGADPDGDLGRYRPLPMDLPGSVPRLGRPWPGHDEFDVTSSKSDDQHVPMAT